MFIVQHQQKFALQRAKVIAGVQALSCVIDKFYFEVDKFYSNNTNSYEMIEESFIFRFGKIRQTTKTQSANANI